MTDEQARLDAEVLTYYGQDVDEDARLLVRSVGGQLEYERVRQMVSARLAPGSRVIDVGGATGVHARWLADAGHDVLLVDPVPEQVAKAAQVGTFDARVGDARALDLPDASADAVLLFGPLYHLVAVSERRRALAEALRVLRPGGQLFAQGISRLTAFADGFVGSDGSPVLPTLRILSTGTWVNPGRGFPGGHFHTARELVSEVDEAGFTDVGVVGIDGPALGSLEWFGRDEQLLELALAMSARLDELATSPEKAAMLADLSPHILAIARKP